MTVFIPLAVAVYFAFVLAVAAGVLGLAFRPPAGGLLPRTRDFGEIDPIPPFKPYDPNDDPLMCDACHILGRRCAMHR